MFKFSRLLIVYIIAVPLALILGLLVTSPGQMTYLFIALVMGIFALPLLMKWHHFLMILFWNSAFNAFFLPGAPDFWLVFALISFAFVFLNHIMFQKQLLRAPELTRPLLFFSAVVLITAWIRGGIGIRAFGGGSYGGKNYIWVFGAIAGYFALTAEPIPFPKRERLAGLFFLSGVTNVLPNVAFVLGPAFYFVFYIVPSDLAVSQLMSDYGTTSIDRITGLGTTCLLVLCFLFCRFGIRGLFDMNRPWRFMFLLITVGAAFFAGFRSVVFSMFLIFALQFYFEGLMRTHYLPIVVGMAITAMVPILFFSKSMPNSVQRAISFLPVSVNTEVLEDAKGSSEWRFQMWEVVLKEVPKYLILGKGYSIDAAEIMAIHQAGQLGLPGLSEFEGSLVAGDYHSGPLSVIMPFGIFGVIGFIWVLIGGYRVLSLNMRYGDPKLRRINTVFLSYYLTYCFTFFFVFGALNSELHLFLGVCGLSVGLNGGVKRKVTRKPPALSVPETLAAEAG